MIPYMIWGDGGRFTNKNENSMNAIAFKSLLAEKGFDTAIIPLWGLPKSAAVKTQPEEESTYWILWEHTVHSLNELFEGVCSDRDSCGNKWAHGSPEAQVAGRRVCGGYRFVCWNLGADLDYMGNDLGFPHHAHLNPCVFCSASREKGTEYPITDLSRNARWKTTLIEPAEGIFVPPTRRPISQLRGFTRYHRPGDLMHTGDLGVLQYVIGGVLCELLESGLFAGTERSRVEQLWGLVSEGYKRLDSSTRLSTLNETMFKPQGTQNATLKAKAAETRSLLYVMIEVCKEADDSSDHHQHRLRMLEHIGAIYDIFKASGNFLPRAKADEALEHLHDFYEHYAWMAHAAIREGKFRYPITTKMHELYHIVDLARWFNP